MKDGISKVKDDIKGVMGIMQGNISKVLDRGAKLEDLQDKSGAVHVCSMMATVHTYIHVHVNQVSNVIIDAKKCAVLLTKHQSLKGCQHFLFFFFNLHGWLSFDRSFTCKQSSH